MDIKTLVVAAAIVLGLPALAGAVHLGLLTLASWFYRQPRPSAQDELRFLVLVPAHNEEQVIASGLEAIVEDLRPGDQMLVVADRCTDRTAEIARSFGASVLERGPEDEPGERPRGRPASSSHARSTGTRS